MLYLLCVRSLSGILLFAACSASLAAAAAVTACGSDSRPAGAAAATASSDSGAAAASAGSGAVAGAADSATAPANQPVIGGHAIIRPGKVGPLKLGAWRRPVMSFVYAVGATAGPAGEDMIVVRGVGNDTLTLAFVDDTLRRVQITRPGAHTMDGLGVGTEMSAIAAEPGVVISGTRTGTRVATLPRYCGMQFRSDSASPPPARVTEIVVRECGAPAISGPGAK